jgi:hypothetical protein
MQQLSECRQDSLWTVLGNASSDKHGLLKLRTSIGLWYRVKSRLCFKTVEFLQLDDFSRRGSVKWRRQKPRSHPPVDMEERSKTWPPDHRFVLPIDGRDDSR